MQISSARVPKLEPSVLTSPQGFGSRLAEPAERAAVLVYLRIRRFGKRPQREPPWSRSRINHKFTVGGRCLRFVL